MSTFGDLRTVGFELVNADGSSLLMNNPAGMQAASESKIGRKQIPTPEVESESKVYRMPSGQLYITGTMVRGSIMTAASGMKIEKKPARVILSAGLFTVSEILPLYDPEDAAPIRDYKIDVRRAVVQRNGVMRARPEVPVWATEIQFHYDPQLLNETIIQDVLTLAGRIAGIGDYRPSKGGPFGRYTVSIIKK